MPEGDTAYRVAKWLDDTFAGSVLTRAELRTAALATTNLEGWRINEVVAYGKHVLIRLGDLTLRSHMRMDGIWHIYHRGQKWRRPAHQARIVLENDRYVAVGYLVSDIDLCETSREHEIIGHLGPNILASDWEERGLQIAMANLQNDLRPIHVALLDQSNIAGLGNEYTNEVCFLRGIWPWTMASQIDVKATLQLSRRLIVANRNRVERTTTGNTRPGQRSYVFARSGRPCRRCGTTISFGRLGNDPSRARHIYWCSHCQPEPKPE